ncbi:hypothetical protein C0992_012543 [Termitomyces sp. T32_za158]|nr:hypothetical protein C0992_012543 [Termitomyces sp. T32_za158]
MAAVALNVLPSFRRSMLATSRTASRTLFAASLLPAFLTPAWTIPSLKSLLELIPPFLLAVPKSKISHSRKSMRSANKGLKDKQSLMAIRSIAQSIQTGEASLGLALGVESMSLNPRPTPDVCEAVDKSPEAHDCIQPMGWTSEMVAETYKVSRQKQDKYALISHERANKAFSSGIFQDEIIPIEVKGTVHSKDDTIRPNVSADSLASLKPVFPNWGEASTTAGNASGVGDGAAICVLTTRERAQRDGMSIIGKYVGSAIVGTFCPQGLR